MNPKQRIGQVPQSTTRRGVLRGLGVGLGALAAPAFVRSARAQGDAEFMKPATLRLGHVPLISSGPVFLAMAKGYFEKVNLKLENRFFTDGALAIPALVAGELDVAASTSNAGLFNAIAKGAPYKYFADRGQDRAGHGSLSIVARKALHEQGLTGLDKFAMLKGRKLAIQAPGSIDQYLLGLALRKAGLDPRKDVDWQGGIAYPEMVKLMGAGQIDAAQIVVPLSYLAQRNDAGKIVAWGHDIEPDCHLAGWVIRTALLRDSPSVAVRFAMVHMQAARDFNKAAAAADDTAVKIMAEATKLPAGVIKSAAPRWTWMSEDGLPNVKSVMAQAAFWTDYYKLVTQPVTEEQVFDLRAVKEAAQRLARANPFV